MREGDRVLTLANGQMIPLAITWIGQRRIDLIRHPQPDLARPIRIHRHAFAPNIPGRDLLVSPDHAILVDGGLIPAKHLVNDGSIIEDRTLHHVHYFHVELERHAIILAEGLPTESYLDTGNRNLFANGGGPIALCPEFRPPKTWSSDAAAPLVTDEARVKPVWERLAARARELDLPVRDLRSIDDPALQLQVGGRMIRPVQLGDDRFVFCLPKHDGTVRVMSRAGSPTDVSPWAEDWRRLGIYVGHIVTHSRTGPNTLPLDHPSLREGWWAIEQAGRLLRRWTDGNALLPVPPGTTMVEIHLAGRMAYRAGCSEPTGRLTRLVA